MPRSLRYLLVIVIGLLTLADAIGLALAGRRLARLIGSRATLTLFGPVDAADRPLADPEADHAIEVMRKRLALWGVSPTIVERTPDDPGTVAVLLPPDENIGAVQAALVSDVRFEARWVAAPEPTEEPFADLWRAEDAARGLAAGDEEYEVFPLADRDVERYGLVVLEGPPLITGRDLVEAKASASDLADGSYRIDFRLDPPAAERFGRQTERRLGERLAIVLDGQVVSTPVVQGRIGERGQISGKFSRREAEDLAAELTAGALPRQMAIVSTTTAPVHRLLGPMVKRTGVLLGALVVLSAALFLLVRD